MYDQIKNYSYVEHNMFIFLTVYHNKKNSEFVTWFYSFTFTKLRKIG